MAVKRDIKYLNRDFSNLKDQLVSYAKTYFPNTYNDFSPSSPGMMFMEMAAYVGDVLSFYLDNQIQETFLQYARQTNNIYDLAYVAAYDNLSFFSLLKEASNLTTNTVSPLQPIDFEFTVHGISGFRRSDKFQVNGIPEKFKRGFFQVTSITHAIQDMKWTTTVKGGFRAQ